jgi:hypothetical protein
MCSIGAALRPQAAAQKLTVERSHENHQRLGLFRGPAPDHPGPGKGSDVIELKPERLAGYPISGSFGAGALIRGDVTEKDEGYMEIFGVRFPPVAEHALLDPGESRALLRTWPDGEE